MILKLQIVKSINDDYFEDDDEQTDIVPFDIEFSSEDIIEVVELKQNETLIEVDRIASTTRECFTVKMSKVGVLAILNGEKDWQNETYTFTEVERVYSTRIDCPSVAA